MPWQIHIKQEMTGIHGFVRDYVVVLSLICFNWTQLELFNVFLEKCASGHKCCHFEVMYHDVVIRVN